MNGRRWASRLAAGLSVIVVAGGCAAGWEAHSGTIRMVADEYGVTTASIYDLFNGTGHHEDPVDKGRIGEDGIHPNAAGTAAQLEFLDSLGYEPVQR